MRARFAEKSKSPSRALAIGAYRAVLGDTSAAVMRHVSRDLDRGGGTTMAAV